MGGKDGKKRWSLGLIYFEVELDARAATREKGTREGIMLIPLLYDSFLCIYVLRLMSSISHAIYLLDELQTRTSVDYGLDCASYSVLTFGFERNSAGELFTEKVWL